MDGLPAVPDRTATATALDFDAIVIGAGVSGLYQLYRLRELGLRVRVFETGTGVGGTWYWNRYPGARFDSESWTYGYSFSQALLEEWDWEEHFAAQPETERYLNYVADKFDLRRDIQFRSRVTAAHYQEDTRSWDVILEDGRRYTTRLLITAIGVLSAATMPTIPGVATFQALSCHTHYWPKEPVRFAGKRVAVIGTGATGVQTITEVAKTAGHLTVFQRTPQWCAPLHNAKISKEEMNRIRADYPAIFARCQETYGCFIHATDPRATSEVTQEEREAFWEKLYGEPGFGIWMGNFRDILVDGFPNMLMVMGPHAGLGNFPRAAEYSADWVTRLIRFARDRDLTRIEATAAGAKAWTDHVIAASEGLLFTEVDSWMTGINRNVEGKQVRRIMRYSGGHPAFRARCEAVAADGYHELALA